MMSDLFENNYLKEAEPRYLYGMDTVEEDDFDIQYNPYNAPFCYSYLGANGAFVYVRPFFYYAEENIFRDEDGNIVYDISKYIPPNHMLIFLERKETYYIRLGEHHAYELQYSYSDNEDERIS